MKRWRSRISSVLRNSRTLSPSFLTLLATGLALVFGLRDVMNFAHGVLFMLGAYLGYSVSALLNFWAALVFVALELKAQLDWVRTLVFMGEGETPEGMIAYEDLIARHEPMQDANRSGEDLWVIFYTAGTTSHPKGVMMSHRGLFVATLG